MMLLLCYSLILACLGQQPRVSFLWHNILPSETNLLPVSYKIVPKDYFHNIPPHLRPGHHTSERVAPQCGGAVEPAERWNAYAAQTEEMLGSPVSLRTSPL
eukprot:NODE_8320_length_357_cov_10.634783_g8154_i0.p2 GENE.NODE_8320_length_357_cov_10.634783_g8154_i0~~NODE_8320_length_357_cov_10.634783_g8154_i0.p2  ORF type:complete len:101 (+),score=10.17 NODE_8320_length_357_cov_10.634783_g8154_i0:53-355(+)